MKFSKESLKKFYERYLKVSPAVNLLVAALALMGFCTLLQIVLPLYEITVLRYRTIIEYPAGRGYFYFHLYWLLFFVLLAFCQIMAAVREIRKIRRLKK